MKKPATFIGMLVLWVIALAHVLRLALGTELSIGGIEIPRWVSVLPVVFFGSLGAWLGRERRAGGGAP